MNTILLHEEIGMFGMTSSEFASLIQEDDVNLLRINSPGGHVFDSWGIYSLMKSNQFLASIDGLAASSASYLHFAAYKNSASENSLIMIHNPSQWIGGSSKDHKKAADLLDKIASIMIKSYSKKMNLEEGKIKEMMNEETWFTGEEAYNLGLVDELRPAIDSVKNSIHYKEAWNKVKLSKMGLFFNSKKEDVTNKTDEIIASAIETVTNKFEAKFKELADNFVKESSEKIQEIRNEVDQKITSADEVLQKKFDEYEKKEIEFKDTIESELNRFADSVKSTYKPPRKKEFDVDKGDDTAENNEFVKEYLAKRGGDK